MAAHPDYRPECDVGENPLWVFEWVFAKSPEIRSVVNKSLYIFSRFDL